MKIYMSDLRKAKMCAKGARGFADRNGIDWKDFLRNGIDISKIENIDDAMVQQVVKAMKNGESDCRL